MKLSRSAFLVPLWYLSKVNRRLTWLSALVICLGLTALLAPVLSPYDPTYADVLSPLAPPSAAHLLGTDDLGRDVLSRILFGSRISLSATLCLVIGTCVVGTIIGMIAGLYGGFCDVVLMRIADTMVAFPDLILAIAIAGVLGTGMLNVTLAIGAVSWTKFARLSRSLVLKIKYQDYMKAAVLSGCRKGRLIWRYLLPNVMPTMIITATTDIGAMMLNLSALSFLGIGIDPQTPEWGNMLSDGRAYLQTSPWLLVMPGIAIFITVLIFNLWSDQLRDRLDPQGQQQSDRSAVAVLKAEEKQIEYEKMEMGYLKDDCGHLIRPQEPDWCFVAKEIAQETDRYLDRDKRKETKNEKMDV